MAEAEVKTKKTTRSKNGKTSEKKAAMTQDMGIGLSQKAIDGVVKLTTTLLADEYLLYTKLRKFHWNVTGPHFLELHEAFEAQYNALESIIDDTAERIRQYGALSIGTLAEFAEHARLKEAPGSNPDARAMVEEIASDHEAMVRHLRADIDLIDDEYDDISAEDYFTGVLHFHEKQAWLMRAMLTGTW